MRKQFISKVGRLILLLFLVGICLSLPIMAEEMDPAAAVTSTWQDILGQVKRVVDGVVFPVLDVILGVLFFVNLGTTYLSYKKRGQFDATGAVILFISLVFTLTAPTYLWSLLGVSG